MSIYQGSTVPPVKTKEDIKRAVQALNLKISALERRPPPIGNSAYPLLEQMSQLPGVANGTTVGNVLGKNFNINQFVNISNGGSGGGGAPGLLATNFVFNEIPSGTINGVNATFTLASAPTTGLQIICRNGVVQTPGIGNDYTISGNTITFLAGNIPLGGDSLLAFYIKP